MNNDSSPANREKICFLVPSTTRGTGWKDIKETHLYRTLLWSLDEHCPNFDISVFIGYDRDDPIYSVFENRQVINAVFMKFQIVWLEQNPDPGNVVKVWNSLGKEALKHDFEYLMVLGDDIQLPKDSSWLRVFQKDLRKNQNIGWSAGWSNNDAIATQFLIHKTHIDIFGFIFPPSLRNWYCDDFLNNVYPDKYNSWRKSYHLLNVGGTPRYTPLNDKKLSEMLVKRHRPQIGRFLNQIDRINI